MYNIYNMDQQPTCDDDKRVSNNSLLLPEKISSSTPYDYYLQQSSYRHCQVCGTATINRIQNGCAICFACKKFYLRNREKFARLRCLTSKNSCLDSVDTTTSAPLTVPLRTTVVGSIWRTICPRCRFARCTAAGMNGAALTNAVSISRKNSEQIHQQQQQQATSSSKSDDSKKRKKRHQKTLQQNKQNVRTVFSSSISSSSESTMKIELSICAVIDACELLIKATNELPMHVSMKCFDSDKDYWHVGMEQTRLALEHVRVFSKSLQKIGGNLPENVVEKFVYKSIVPVTLAKTARVGPRPMGMNALNENMCRNFFPEYLQSQQEAVHLHSLISTWNPSPAEFSLLITMLFFSANKENDHLSVASNNDNNSSIAPLWRVVLFDVLNQLEFGLEAIVDKACNHDATKIAERLRYFWFVAGKMGEAGRRRFDILQNINARRPDLTAPYSFLQQLFQQNNNSSYR